MASAVIVTAKPDAVAAYKRVLQEVLDKRPSGTRQRLADALKRNRSFVTQIANPAYAVPIPARHVATIFGVCHFSPVERAAFLDAYHLAHPRSPVAVSERSRARHAHLMLPDFGDEERNRAFDALLETFIDGVARLASGGRAKRTSREENDEEADQRDR
jgi:hypothetical protein